MHLLENNHKILLLLFIFLLTQAEVLAKSGATPSYPELDLYRQTLAPEELDKYKKALEEYEKMPHVAKVYSDNNELNLHYKAITTLADSTFDQATQKSNNFYHLSKQAAELKDTKLEIESTFQAFNTAFWSKNPNYHKAFEMAIILEKKLALVSENEFPDKRAAYFKLGEAYYLFHEYNKSIELLEHAITEEPPRSFTDRANLDARKIIGICYANLDEMETSDYYFKSTLKSNDIVLDRPTYNAIALSHLACNSVLKGDYEKSLVLDLEVLPFLKKGDDYGHVAGMYACQCFSYFGLEDASEIATVADSVLYYALKDDYNKSKRLKQAYTILSKYSVEQGDIEKALEYNSALIEIYKQEDREYSSQYIVQANQKVAEDEMKAKELEMETQHKAIIIMSIVFILAIAALSVIVLLYMGKESAYKALVRKNQEWANSTEVVDKAFRAPLNTNDESEEQCTAKECKKNKHSAINIEKTQESVSKEDLALMSRIFTVVVDKKQYASPGFNLEALSEELGTNRKYISKAINSATGKNFNTYINEYRVKEAIRLLSVPENKFWSVEEIGLQVGFSSRSSFYEAFRKITGISPSQFKKTKKNMSSSKE